jgi:hypothetical protein
MFKIEKETVIKFIREDLPVMGVDAVIGGVRMAREISDRAARLIAEGTIPAPGFIVDMARDKIDSEEDYYKVAEPEHGWDKTDLPGKMEEALNAASDKRPKTIKKGGKKKSARRASGKTETAKSGKRKRRQKKAKESSGGPSS